MPAHHDVRPEDVFARRLHGALAAAADRGPADFAELLLVPGVGARTLLSLAMVAEVVHGAPCRFADPARFSLAHGGKDRHPYPVPTRVYDETISVLRSALSRARLGRSERIDALRRLDARSRAARAHRHRPRPPRASSPPNAAAPPTTAAAASSAGNPGTPHPPAARAAPRPVPTEARPL